MTFESRLKYKASCTSMNLYIYYLKCNLRPSARDPIRTLFDRVRGLVMTPLIRVFVAALIVCAYVIAARIARFMAASTAICNKPVAAGGLFDCGAMTTTCKALPHDTTVNVTHADSGRSLRSRSTVAARSSMAASSI